MEMDQPAAQEQLGSFLVGVLRGVESWCGAALATIVTLGLALLILGAASAFKDEGNHLAELGVGVWLAWWTFLDLRYLGWLWKGVREHVHPLAPYVALLQPRPPLLLRPLVAIWWLAHFAMAIILVVILAEIDRNAFGVSDRSDRLFALAGVFFASLGCTYCANGYLLLAVTTFTTDPLRVVRLWSKRLAFDLLMAALSLLVSLHFFN